MSIYVEVTSLPLIRKKDEIFAPVSALAERLPHSDDTIELRFYRLSGRIHCYVGIHSFLRATQIKNILDQYRCGAMLAENVPALPSETLLLRDINESITLVKNSAPDRKIVLNQIQNVGYRCEQLYYTLSQMEDHTGFSIFVRAVKRLSPAATTCLRKNMGQENEIYGKLLQSPALFQSGICVFDENAGQRMLLVDELKYAFPGLKEYPMKRNVMNEQTIWNSIQSIKSPVSDSGALELLSVYHGCEIEAFFSFNGIPQRKGIPINKDSLFEEQKTDRMKSEKRLVFGKTESGEEQSIPLHALCKHVFISGAPGTGKGNLIFSIVEQLHRYRIPVLLIESAKEEQHHLRKTMPDLRVWRPAGGQFLLNPFELPPNVTMADYRSALLQILTVCFKGDGALEELYRTTLTRCFSKYGFQENSKADSPDITPFGLSEFISEYNHLLLNNGYSARTQSDMRTAGITRLRTLFDQNPDVFDTVHSVPVSELVSGENLLQLNCLTTMEAKQMFCTLLLISLGAWLRLNGKHSREPRLIVLMDESHNLLHGVERSDGTSYSFARDFQNLLLEMRSVGVGFIVADQSADNLPRGISEVCATKIFLGASRYSGIDGYADVFKADEETLDHLYLLDAGKGLWNTYGMSGGAYFWTENVIDRYKLDEKYPPNNSFVKKNESFMCQTFSECSGCATKQGCSLQHKRKSRGIAAKLMMEFKPKLVDLLMKYQIARDKKKDSDLQSLEDFKAAEKMLRVILWAIAMYLSDYMSGIEGYCSIVQFVRQFNREAEIQMNTRLVQVLLAYMKEIEKEKKSKQK